MFSWEYLRILEVIFLNIPTELREFFTKIVNSFKPLIIYDGAFCENKLFNFL